LRQGKILSTFGILFYATAIRLVRGQGLERNQAPRDVIGAFMGEKVSDQMTSATRNDPTPLFGILLEGGALKRVDLVANEAGNGHGVPSFWMGEL
jgi:hypothetical protein